MAKKQRSISLGEWKTGAPEAPSLEACQAIKPGDFVKVADMEAGERFWLKVISTGPDTLLCEVDNMLVFSEAKAGDKLNIEYSNIVEIKPQPKRHKRRL